MSSATKPADSSPAHSQSPKRPPPGTLRRLLTLLLPYKWPIALGMACLLVATPLSLYHPLVWKRVVDDVIGKSEYGQLVPALVLMGVVHFAGTALQAFRTWVLGVVGQRFICDLRERVYECIQAHSLQFFHDRRSGDIMARAIGDVDALQEVAINGVDNILSNALQFVWVAAILIHLQWKLGIATLLPMLGVAVLVYFFNDRIKAIYRAIRDRLGDLSAKLQENLMGILVIKAFAREEDEQARFQRENKRYFAESLRGVVARTFYMPSVMSVGFISNLAALGFGAWLIMRGEFTLGGLVAYRGYWWHLVSPVMSLAQINEMFQRASASAARVFELLDAPIEVEDAKTAATLADVKGAVAFDRVTFAYPGGARVLSGVSIDIQPGQKVGLVGSSGAGKSTVLSLLLRLYDPLEGRVLVDGHDVRNVTQKSLRRCCAVVTQEPYLFNDTIRSNIVYAMPGASEAQMIEAAKQANAHEFIERLPKGYDTVVGERGVKLSGGQKQRICIARAFLANPRILLLDEATAAVEPESESIIQAALARLLEGRTALIVSHRLSMVRDADQILVVDGGGITERGTHDELLARSGWYARMYRLQMGGEAVGVA